MSVKERKEMKPLRYLEKSSEREKVGKGGEDAGK